jgi:hemolysin activation/secretion protein
LQVLVVLEAFAHSLATDVQAANPVAIERPATLSAEEVAMLDRFLAPRETEPAVVATVDQPIADPQIATASRSRKNTSLLAASQRLVKVAITPTGAAATTTQSFLTEQRSAAGTMPVVGVEPKTVEPKTNPESTTIAQNTPTTRTRTEVVEERIEESTTFMINQINVVGGTIFKPEELSVYTKPLEGKSVNLAELRQAVDSITKLYLSKGYVNSRAFLGNQQVVDGIVTIQILEGSIESVNVEGSPKLEKYVRDRLSAATVQPLRGDTLEEQLRLLQTDPALEAVEASLSPGTAVGKSILTVRVKEAKTAFFGLTSDNYSPPVVGSERYGIYAGLRSSLIPGDEFFGSYNRSTSGGSNALDFLYRAPVNANNGTIQLRVAPSWYKITDKEIGNIFDIEGNSQLYDLSFRQPLVRTFRNEFALSLGFGLQNGNTNVGGTNLFDTNNRVRVLRFGQDLIARDTQGLWSARSNFNFGLDIFDATDNPSPLADGQFFSWTGQLQRIQRFNANNVLIGQFDVQLSPDALLPSQQFIYGGGQSVRGYRQNARFGDNGLRFSLENRTVVLRDAKGNATVQVAPFFDMGSVWNVSDNPVASPRQKFLAGAGLGLILQPIKGLNMRFDYAIPFTKADEKNDNLQDSAFYFSLGYQP